MHEVALSLGSNSGNRFFYMRKMEEALSDILYPPMKLSDLFETEPVDVTHEQPSYLNRIIKGYYPSTPAELLQHCIIIERQLGRINKGMRTERTADIDILIFGNTVLNTDTLTLPHPAITHRRFCLEGLNQIMPHITIASTGKTVRDYYQTMDGTLKNQGLKTVMPTVEINNG